MSERDTEGVVVVPGELSEPDRIAAELGVAVRTVSDVGSVTPGSGDAALAGVEVPADGGVVLAAEPLRHDRRERLADQLLGPVAEHPLD